MGDHCLVSLEAKQKIGRLPRTSLRANQKKMLVGSNEIPVNGNLKYAYVTIVVEKDGRQEDFNQLQVKALLHFS